MILDFNSDKLRFSLKNVAEYNIDTIYDNFEKFKKFVNESVISDTFDKIYKTEIFQVTLLDETTNYISDLLIVYNAIAILQDLPEITEKELKKQLLARGFSIKRTTRYLYAGMHSNAYKVFKEIRQW